MYLSIDIGGTKVTVARFERDRKAGGVLRLMDKQRYASREHPALEAIVRDYLGRAGEDVHAIKAVGIGVAGPVVGRRAQVTNLPWIVDAEALERELGVPVRLVNDLEAHGYGIPLLAPAQLRTLNPGDPRPGNAALIAAGTGLGEAVLFWDGRRLVPSATEGGHASFGPRTPEEVELLAFLMKKYPDHVSWERVVSGLDGFRNLYDFLVATKRITVPEAHAKACARGDIGAEIVGAAGAGEEFARVVLQWFARLYGAEAGNLALKCLALGGVYVAGGIVGKIMPWIERGAFMEGFLAKGRFRDLLRSIPVYVVMDDDLALKGGAVVAMSVERH